MNLPFGVDDALATLELPLPLLLVIRGEISAESVAVVHEVSASWIWIVNHGVVGVLVVLADSVSEPGLLDMLAIAHQVSFLPSPGLDVGEVVVLLLSSGLVASIVVLQLTLGLWLEVLLVSRLEVVLLLRHLVLLLHRRLLHLLLLHLVLLLHWLHLLLLLHLLLILHLLLVVGHLTGIGLLLA